MPLEPAPFLLSDIPGDLAVYLGGGVVAAFGALTSAIVAQYKRNNQLADQKDADARATTEVLNRNTNVTGALVETLKEVMRERRSG